MPGSRSAWQQAEDVLAKADPSHAPANLVLLDQNKLMFPITMLDTGKEIPHDPRIYNRGQVGGLR